MSISSTNPALLAVLALATMTAMALAVGYIQLTIHRGRHRTLRVLLLVGLSVLLSELALVNWGTDAEIQAHARRVLCRQRMDRIATLLQRSRRLNHGRYPATLKALKIVPDYRSELLVSPLTGKPYRYTVRADGQRVLVVSPRSRALPWRHPGHHQLALAPDRVTLRWIESRP